MSSTTEVLSNWSTLIENFQTSPQQFYSVLTSALQKRQMPNARIDRVSFRESHLLSAKREYLRISCKGDFYFAICGAPFGTGFFVSWWLLQPPDGCLAQMFAPFPGLSILARAMVKPWTYYRIDTATMFRTATHQAVLEVIDMIISEKNLPALPESERKPILKGFLA
ncbi:MAG: hypothetical protein IPM63_11580 [Acidobacteriota bacterium]|nr:MAG: hypothetical protein IPM63_11580 [Acidobacteriota bacterium]